VGDALRFSGGCSQVAVDGMDVSGESAGAGLGCADRRRVVRSWFG